MKAHRMLVAILIAFTLAGPVMMAQDKLNTPGKAPATASLKLQVTIVEREGDKKVANLPYTFFAKAGEGGVVPWTKLRTGSRVPVYVGKEHGMQYIDVGTNIDARAFTVEDGRFDITLNLERSWVAGEVEVPLDKSDNTVADAGTHFKEPIIRQFKTELTMAMHDGQTSEITQAVDPGSGRVLTITVTMNVVK